MDTVRYSLTDRLSPETLPSDRARRLFELWSTLSNADTLPRLSDFKSEKISWCADHLAVAIADDSGAYRYASSGQAIERDGGTDVSGRSTRDIAGGFGRFLEAAFDIATLQNIPILTRNAAPDGPVHVWSRLILPVALDDTALTAALCLVEADGFKIDVVRAVATEAETWIATLDPVYDTQGVITDYSLMPLAAPQSEPDASWSSLSSVFARNLTAEEIDGLQKGAIEEQTVSRPSGRGDDAMILRSVRFCRNGNRKTVVISPLPTDLGSGGQSSNPMEARALEITKTGYWSLTVKDGALLISPDLYRIWRTEPDAEQATRSALHSRYPPKIRSKLNAALDRAIAEGRGFKLNAPLRAADGNIVYTHIIVECQKAADGSVLSVSGIVRDVTDEHERLRAANAASEDPRGAFKRIADFLSVSDGWHWETDADHNFTFLTPNAARNMPRPVEEMLKTSRFDLPVVEDDKDKLNEHRSDLDARKNFKNLTLRIAAEDGSIQIINWSGKPVFDGSGNFLGYRGTGRDVTVQTETAEALETEHEKLQTAVAGLGFSAIDVDLTENEIVFSLDALEALGLDDVEGLTFDAFAAKFERPGDDDILTALISPPDAHLGSTVRATRKIGDVEKHFKLHFSRTNPKDGGSRRANILLEDETEAVVSLRALEIASLELEQAQSSAKLGSWSHDNETGLTLCSDSFRALIGWEKDGDTPALRKVFERFHPDCREDVQVRLDRVQQSGGRETFEARIAQDKETTIDAWVEFQADVDGSHNVTRLAIVLQDITRQKAEAQERERILAAINQTRDGIILCDADGLALFVNGTAEALFGYDLEALNRRGGVKAVAADPDAFESFLSGDATEGEHDLSVKIEDGQDRIMAVSRVGFGQDAEKPTAQIITFHDVTARVTERDLLKETEKELRDAHRLGGFASWRFDIGSEQYRWSDEMFALTGHEKDSFRPARSAVLSLLPDADSRAILAHEEALLETGVPQKLDIQCQRPDESFSDFTVTMELERSPDGSPLAIHGTFQDITERKQAERLINAREQELREAQRLGRMGSWSYRFGDEHYEWSPELYELLGYNPKRFKPTPQAMLSLHPREDRERIEDSDAYALETGETYSLDIKIRRADKSFASVIMTNKCQMDANGNIVGFFGTIQDVTDRREAEEQLEKLAYYDALTEVGNRAHLRKALSRIISRCLRTGGKAALFLLDIDRFKDVNDAMGHKVGDNLIRAIAERLSNLLKSGSSIARLGGDEFAIIIPDLQGIEDANLEIARIFDAFELPFPLDETELHVHTSIGVVMLPSDTASADEIMRQADLALYRAKDEGRGRASYYDPGFDEALRDRLALSHDLRATLKAGGDGLMAYFQPQVQLDTGELIGFETLLRWQHPVRGFVRPDEFISIAEGNGLIGELGVWILRESCRQAQVWKETGVGTFDIAVNVSPAQFRQVNMIEEVRRALEDTGLSPSQLTLELTESVFVDSGENTIKNLLDQFAEMGIKLALDDFGTGYSSLGYLHALPFHKLKIDRCFVDGAESEDEKKALLRGILGLGRGLGMTVVAEGAENADQARLLRDWSCDLIQGYVFGRPVPASQVPDEIARIAGEAPIILGMLDEDDAAETEKDEAFKKAS
ncbi:MAG: EAL domain-containing protein [Pseudomonadota bacterium]